MSKYPISDEEMDRLGEKVGGDEDLIRDLIALRGGCSCHIRPPCHACCDPLTVDEAIDLGIYEDPQPFKACGGTGKAQAPADETTTTNNTTP